MKSRGFTVVELLVVIIVIAILAGIAIVSYGYVKNDADKSSRISDVSNLNKVAEIVTVRHNLTPDTHVFWKRVLVDAGFMNKDGTEIDSSKKFIFCANNKEFAIISWGALNDGKMIASIRGKIEAINEVSSTAACDSTGIACTYQQWSFTYGIKSAAY